MTKAVVTAVCLTILGAGSALADDTLWTRFLSLGAQTQAMSVRCQGTDVYLGGSLPGTNANAFAAKYSGSGNLLWTKTVDLDSFDYCGGVAIGPDSSSYLGLWTSIDADQPLPVTRLVRLTPAGDTVWTRSRSNSMGGALLADSANGVVILGTAGYPVRGDSLWIASYASSGSLAWSRTYKLSTTHSAVDLCPAGSGNLLAAVTVIDTASPSALLVKFSAAGETIWTRQYPDTVATGFIALAPAGAGGVFLLASRSSNMVLSRADSLGSILWATSLPASTPARDLAADESGNCYLTYTDQDQDFKVDKYSSAGTFLGTGRAGSPYRDIPVSLAVGSDGHVIVTGISADTLGNMRAYTVKFSGTPSGIEGKCEVRSAKCELLPNPVTGGFATIRVQGFEGSRVPVANLRVFDVSGRCVLARQLVTGNWELGIPLDLRTVPAGVYLVRFDAGSFTATQKLVVQR